MLLWFKNRSDLQPPRPIARCNYECTNKSSVKGRGGIGGQGWGWKKSGGKCVYLQCVGIMKRKKRFESLSLSFYLSRPLSLYFSLSIYLYHTHTHTHTHTHSLYIYPSLTVHYHSFFLSLSISLFQSSHSRCLSLSVYLFLSHSLSISPPVSLSLSNSLHPHLSHPHPLEAVHCFTPACLELRMPTPLPHVQCSTQERK